MKIFISTLIFIFVLLSSNTMAMHRKTIKKDLYNKLVSLEINEDSKLEISMLEQIKLGIKKKFVYNPNGTLFIEHKKDFVCPFCDFFY